jgi:predicted methyltransferase
LIFTEGSGVARLTNFSFIGTEDSSVPANYTLQYNYVFAGSKIGGVVTVTTITPFAGQGESPPESGELKIEGENGSNVVIEATGNGQARITIDENPDDPDVVIVEGPWDSFFDE